MKSFCGFRYYDKRDSLKRKQILQNVVCIVVFKTDTVIYI